MEDLPATQEPSKLDEQMDNLVINGSEEEGCNTTVKNVEGTQPDNTNRITTSNRFSVLPDEADTKDNTGPASHLKSASPDWRPSNQMRVEPIFDSRGYLASYPSPADARVVGVSRACTTLCCRETLLIDGLAQCQNEVLVDNQCHREGGCVYRPSRRSFVALRINAPHH
jgi:hypothetical protein